MEKIYLSDSGPKVSPAIYGFWRWSAADLDSNKIQKLVDFCLEKGINTFDHADRYADYQAEEAFGKLIKNKSINRDEIILSSKAGICVPSSRNNYKVHHVNTSAKHIQVSVDNSLKNLNTDYLDLFLLENLDAISNIEETAFQLQKMIREGKVKNIGIVNFSVYQHQLLESLIDFPIVSNHVDFNLLDTRAFENGILDYTKQKFMRPLAVSPLAGGRIEKGTDEKALKIRKKLKEFSEKYQSSVESLAVAWILKLGALPLIGTLEENRINNIVEAFNIELEHEDWYALYQSSRPNLSID